MADKSRKTPAQREPPGARARQPATPVPEGYAALLEDIKARIRAAQLRAATSANRELLLLYYSIGLDLHQRTRRGAWGSSVIDRLAGDLRKAFPGMRGFSPRNLRRMRAFYRAYPLEPGSLEIWPPAVAKSRLVPWPPAAAGLPWAHNVLLLEKVKDPREREWYAQAALEHGWSRNMLALQHDAHPLPDPSPSRLAALLKELGHGL